MRRIMYKTGMIIFNQRLILGFKTKVKNIIKLGIDISRATAKNSISVPSLAAVTFIASAKIPGT